ncbi:MAG: GerMN domain-containing protein [Thermoleophilia bacterium]|nr:GerMN domain-containing protein [Thermoleophilia bacterium]MDH5280678.1 GerMN domain-containing protein [Thermoleophilia bacterium]
MKHVLPLVAAALFVAGCGGGNAESTSTDTETTTTAAATTALRVYWLRDGTVWPVAREVEATEAVATAALEELLAGPTSQEDADLDASTAIPPGAELNGVEVTDGVATTELSAEITRYEALAQIVNTLTQFPTVKTVELQGKSYTRADFEDQTPSVLVESPLAFETVGSPFRVTGTANTFEATFSYELTDTDGKIVDENFVTATSGTGTRGTFDFTTAPFAVPFDGIGSLIVFERSAEDGSRINVVEIPLRMEK